MSRVFALKFAQKNTHNTKQPGILAESAGVSYVNGERVSGDNMKPNTNPYANANAPLPEPPYPSGDNSDHHRSSYGNNLGYPPYPGSSSGNGYPPQSTNQAGRHHDLGYPPYPTQNRMPVPGQPPMYPQNAGYPPQQYPGYQNYPYQNYPIQHGYNNHPNSINRRGNAVGIIPSMILVGFSGLFPLLVMTW